jgi:hypothetical protein
MENPAGSDPGPTRLFDERSRPADFRTVYGSLLQNAAGLDVALTRIRFSDLDFRRGELEGLGSLRLLLAEVNAVHLDAEAHAVMFRSEKRESIAMLTKLLGAGVIEVRSAPLGGWSPDFSVFRGQEGPSSVLIGFHWFERPFPHRGPALTSLHGPEGARLAGRRFEECWERAHDVGAAVLGILERARSR